MFKLKKKISKLASLVLAAAICAPLFWGVGVARAARVSDAASDGLVTAPASRAAVASNAVINRLVTTKPTIAQAASNSALRTLADVTPQSTVSEIRLTSSTTSVESGSLHEFTVDTTTQYAHVVPYGGSTAWVYWMPSFAIWCYYGIDDPYAENDGKTRYGLCIIVNLEKGNVFANNPTIYFNGKNVTPASGNYNAFSKQDDRSATIIIDLGKATGSDPVVRRTVTFESNGGTSVSSVKVVNGHPVEKPLNPSKEGMYFWGWYEDAALTKKHSFYEPILKDMTLYARWETTVNKVDKLTLSGNVGMIEPGLLPDCYIKAKSNSLTLNMSDERNVWVKWDGYCNVWDYEEVDPFGTDLIAVDDNNTHYGMKLYLRLEDGYELVNTFKVYYQDPNGRTLDFSNHMHTGRDINNTDGYLELFLDFGLAKEPAPVVFDFYNETKIISAFQMEALDYLEKNGIVSTKLQNDGSIYYNIDGDDSYDFVVWPRTGKMQMFVGHYEGVYTVDSSILSRSHYTSIKFDFPKTVQVELFRGELTPGKTTQDALTFLESKNAVNVRNYAGSILQYDLDKNGSYDFQWDKSANILKTLPTNSIRSDFYISQTYLTGTKYESIFFWMRYQYSVNIIEGWEELSSEKKKALAYLADNNYITKGKLGSNTIYDLDKDGTFDVSVNLVDQIKQLESTNLYGFYTIREGLPMDCGIESFTFIFSNDVVFDFRNGPVDRIDEWFDDSLWYIATHDLVAIRETEEALYFDLDKDGTEDIMDNGMIEMLPTSNIEGDFAFFGSALASSSYESITFRFPIKISSVSLSVKAPASGAAPSFDVTLPSGAQYGTTNSAFEDGTMATTGVIWTDLTTGNRLPPSGVNFAANHKYEVAIGLSAAKGYLFKPGATVKINGYTASNVVNNGDMLVAYLRFAALKPTPTAGPLSEKTIEVGKTFQYTVSGVSATSITWSVGNTAVATVSSNGTVTGKSVGNTYLYAKLPDGTTIKCLIRVVYPALKISYTEKTLHINQTFSFTASGAAGQKVTWSVGNTAVATVTSTGTATCKVTGKSAANTYLYAKTADGRTAKCLLKIVDPGTLGINYTEKTVYLGQTFTFTAKNAGILKPTWSVGNTAIATVDAATGKVTPKTAGNTYLYVKTEDGRSAKCLLKVVDPGPLSITYTEKTIKVGATFTFAAKNPAGQTVSWRVGNTTVATVDATGKVTGKTVGNTYLYASTPDGREVRCLIKVVA